MRCTSTTVRHLVTNWRLLTGNVNASNQFNCRKIWWRRIRRKASEWIETIRNECNATKWSGIMRLIYIFIRLCIVNVLFQSFFRFLMHSGEKNTREKEITLSNRCSTIIENNQFIVNFLEHSFRSSSSLIERHSSFVANSFWRSHSHISSEFIRWESRSERDADKCTVRERKSHDRMPYLAMKCRVMFGKTSKRCDQLDAIASYLVFKSFYSNHFKVYEYAFAKNVSFIRPRRLFPQIQLLCHYYFHWKVFLFSCDVGRKKSYYSQATKFFPSKRARLANNTDENRLHWNDYKKISYWISVFISNVNSNKQETVSRVHFKCIRGARLTSNHDEWVCIWWK